MSDRHIFWDIQLPDRALFYLDLDNPLLCEGLLRKVDEGGG